MTARTDLVGVALAATLAAAPVLAADPPPVPYPAGYRSWTHVKTMQILEGHPLFASFGGIHHLYANPKAMQGYRSGRFPDGAVIVFDLLAPVNADHTVTDGNRKVVGVMHKDAKRYAATGGWGFEGFKGDSRTERAVGTNAKGACFGCHEPQRGRDYVFSAWKE
ncbi:MAG: cytochrome P460 family protein [Burkholderiales bacterium]|nr:cytochrome P460 family protein [Burkholderiales bacterium]MCE7876353.1 cytochrome C [Betaproteobacteria bacterium PRO3]